jgi:uncharacterized protein YidB (DUF937 family)
VTALLNRPEQTPVAEIKLVTPRRSARLAAAIIGTIGALMLAAVVLGDGFGRAAAGQRLVDGARPAVDQSGIVQLRDDTDLVIDTGGAILNEALPALAERLGLGETEFAEVLNQRFPALAASNERKVELGTALDATVSNLEAHQGDFELADSIPLRDVDLVVMPLAVAGVGAVFTAASVIVLRGTHRSRRTALLVSAGLGLVLAVGPLAVSMPLKAAGAEDLLGSLVTTEENAATTREQFELTTAAVAEVRDGLLPAAAASIGVTPNALASELATDIPDLAGLDGVDDALLRIEADVRFREERLDDFADVKPVPFVAVTWVIVGLGLTVTITAGQELLSARGSRTR